MAKAAQKGKPPLPQKKPDVKPPPAAAGARAKRGILTALSNASNRMKAVAQTPMFKTASVATTVILFLGAIVMIVLYSHEWSKGAIDRAAIAAIREFAVEYDPRLLHKGDEDVLSLAQNLSDLLVNWARMNTMIQNDIDEISEKLSKGWQIFSRNIYFFSKTTKTWWDAKDYCERRNSSLITVLKGEEQEYIDKESNRVAQHYWICLRRDRKASRAVKWCQPGIVAATVYWKAGEPNGKFGDCVTAAPNCPLKQCWDDRTCDSKFRYVCKKSPDEKWYE